MFGFGWGEIVVIGIVALIAIGPKELPTVLRSLGHWMGKIRRMANEFQGQFQEALREAELTDLKKQAEEVTNSITSYDPLKDTQKELEICTRVRSRARRRPTSQYRTRRKRRRCPVRRSPMVRRCRPARFRRSMCPYLICPCLNCRRPLPRRISRR